MAKGKTRSGAGKKVIVASEVQSTGNGLGSESLGYGLGSTSLGSGLGDNNPFNQNPSELEQNFMAKNDHKPQFTIVIPYLKAKAQGEELKFALRSIEAHFRSMNYNVVVIGDREDWFEDLTVKHIDMPVISNNAQEDVINKIKEILLSDLVANKIIWSNDDIYFVSPVEPCDIQTLKIDGNLKDDGRAGVYSDNRRRTIELLNAKKIPVRNFATHTPVMYDKNKLIELFESIPELNEGGYLFSSVYFNFHYPHHKPTQTDWKADNWSLRLISNNPPLNVFNKLVVTKKFLNNAEQGYSTVLTDYLEKTFPESSKYEA